MLINLYDEYLLSCVELGSFLAREIALLSANGSDRVYLM